RGDSSTMNKGTCLKQSAAILGESSGARFLGGATDDPAAGSRLTNWAGRKSTIWRVYPLFAWLRLLARNRLAVHRSRAHVVARATVITLGLLQEAWFGRRVNRTPIRGAPLFILGHRRSGTTLKFAVPRRALRAGPTRTKSVSDSRTAAPGPSETLPFPKAKDQ